MEYVKPDPMPDPIVDPSKIKEHNDKYLESLQSGFGGSWSSMGPPTPMGMGPPTPMTMDLNKMAQNNPWDVETIRAFYYPTMSRMSL